MKRTIYILTISLPLLASCSCGNNASAVGPAPADTIVPSADQTYSGTMASSDAPAPKPQEKIDDLEFDKTIHNFGDVLLSDGPLSCTFTLKNNGEKPAVIYNVVTSCGCTDVKWTKEPIMPGKTGTISTTYTNDEGPYPFDKTLTAYISGIGRPIVLHIRGISHEKQLSPAEMYPVKLSEEIGIKATELKCGNIEQGGSRSDEVNIANLSNKPVTVSFSNISKGLSLSVEPNPVPAGKTARLIFTVSADRNIWGKNFYYATPVIDGKSSGTKLSVYAFTKENFDGMTEAERKTAAKPIFASSTFSAGKIKAGKKIDAEFQFSNTGNTDFLVYKIDCDIPSASFEKPAAVKPGTKGIVKAHLDTTGLPEGEMLITCTLTTNSPARPIVNLFITGWIE